MENRKAMQDYLREVVNKDIITKYLFLKTIEARCDDKEIADTYGINAHTIRKLYSAISEDERARIERLLKEQIDAGEIDLGEETIKWQREAEKRKQIKIINTENRSKKGKEH